MKHFFVVSNSIIFCVGIKSIIESIDGCRVEATFHRISDISKTYTPSNKNYFIMDVDSSNVLSMERIQQIKESYPNGKIIVISKSIEKEIILNQLQTGIDGILNHNFEINELQSAIGQIESGRKYSDQTCIRCNNREYS